MANREYDYLFKLVIIGNSGVGKSALLLRFADDTFSENYITTIGVDFRFKTLKVDNKGLKLQIWDTAGQERFRTITNAYYKGADAIVIVYDTTCQQSFDDIEKFWLNEIESYAEKNAELLLLGNKSDLSTKQVSSERVQEYAQKRNMTFFETSAKTADGVEEAFKNIAIKLMSKRDQQVQDKKNKKKQQRQSSSSSKRTEDFSNSSEIKQEDESKNVNLWSNKSPENAKQEQQCQC
ncbi:unnamed protein product (macronuclear) [Paramecium tetraurelia]|uniref:Chromosome undetermined scaffold_38, whole genome shotgun sequence n=1 Tax=Paramecium tetraurelia TaxID=5888 RepID=Q3SDK3_PARTE|nr:uncharacterized protein GSPATT00013499001 [Paramecium tetraurelia]CAI39355.1 rab_A55 [Paramecium tetraurelia]CAK78052.1 unnamed protein product [Paramecium tetraurelia]|eukprot:XP_001445449.1 hypothetical protein (macronuclear) [Paramecium tetraurelia strain d4-2]